MLGIGSSQGLEPPAHAADAGIACVATGGTICGGVRRCDNDIMSHGLHNTLRYSFHHSGTSPMQDVTVFKSAASAVTGL